MATLKAFLVIGLLMTSFLSFATSLSGEYSVRSCAGDQYSEVHSEFIVWNRDKWLLASINDVVFIKEEADKLIIKTPKNRIVLKNLTKRAEKVSYKGLIYSEGGFENGRGCGADAHVGGCFYTQEQFSLEKNSNGDITYKNKVFRTGLAMFVIPFYSVWRTECELQKLN